MSRRRTKNTALANKLDRHTTGVVISAGFGLVLLMAITLLLLDIFETLHLIATRMLAIK